MNAEARSLSSRPTSQRVQCGPGVAADDRKGAAASRMTVRAARRANISARMLEQSCPAATFSSSSFPFANLIGYGCACCCCCSLPPASLRRRSRSALEAPGDARQGRNDVAAAHLLHSRVDGPEDPMARSHQGRALEQDVGRGVWPLPAETAPGGQAASGGVKLPSSSWAGSLTPPSTRGRHVSG